MKKQQQINRNPEILYCKWIYLHISTYALTYLQTYTYLHVGHHFSRHIASLRASRRVQANGTRLGIYFINIVKMAFGYVLRLRISHTHMHTNTHERTGVLAGISYPARVTRLILNGGLGSKRNGKQQR